MGLSIITKGEQSVMIQSEEYQYNPSVGQLILNFMGESKYTYFYSYFFQFIVIVYMYMRIGHGKYWKFLLAASVFGVVAACLEHFAEAYEKTYGKEATSKTNIYFIWLIQELFWIPTEYAIPYLNLIKLEAVTQKFISKLLKIFVGFILFAVFIVFRGFIGYNRWRGETLESEVITKYHGFAFGVMALADLLCTIFIIYELYRNLKHSKAKGEEEVSVSTYIMKSSYAILLLIDVCSIVLALLNIILTDNNAKQAIFPFQTLKSNFILILAIDTLIIKINTNRITSSSNTKKSITQLRTNNTSYGGALYSNISMQPFNRDGTVNNNTYNTSFSKDDNTIVGSTPSLKQKFSGNNIYSPKITTGENINPRMSNTGGEYSPVFPAMSNLFSNKFQTGANKSNIEISTFNNAMPASANNLEKNMKSSQNPNKGNMMEMGSTKYLLALKSNNYNQGSGAGSGGGNMDSMLSSFPPMAKNSPYSSTSDISNVNQDSQNNKYSIYSNRNDEINTNKSNKKNKASNIVLDSSLDSQQNNNNNINDPNSQSLLTKMNNNNSNVKKATKPNEPYSLNKIMKSPNLQYDGLDNRVSMQYYSANPDRISPYKIKK